MSTTIYDSPSDAVLTVSRQGSFAIDITRETVWFFEHDGPHGDARVTVPLAQLPAIYRAIGAFLEGRGIIIEASPKGDEQPEGISGVEESDEA